MESLLTTIVDYLWRQSWQIALLVVVVGLASWALRNRSAHVRYLLWLLVLAKCLTPPVAEVPPCRPARQGAASHYPDHLDHPAARKGAANTS